jgi:hypothetical protein
MKWPLIHCRVAGGMRPAEGKAPFARGAAVLEGTDEPGRFLQVRTYTNGDAVGDVLDRAAWEALVAAGQGMSLSASFPAEADVAIWILRPSFAERVTFLDQLSGDGALVGLEVARPGGQIVALMDEDKGNPVRDRWAMEQFEAAWQLAHAARWPEALGRADLAFVLSRGLVVERVALLSLAMERVGRKTGADGLLDMAAGSRGAAFGREVREKRDDFARQCPAVAPSAAPQTGLRFAREIYAAKRRALRRSFTAENAA